MIRIHQLSHSFEGVPVLSGLSLKLEAHRTHMILGPSGCGKSTLLRILMGLLKPDEGQVIIESPLSPSPIGYVIQEGGLFPHMTAGENVTLRARTLEWNPERITPRLNELARLVNLPETLLSRHPRELSGGQRQRVSLMRALMLDPEILLLDEPFGALDPIVRSDLQRELKDIFAALRKTVIAVTHDLSEAAFFGDSITLLNQGKLVQHGNFSDLVKCPADPFVTRFLNAQRPPARIRELL